MRPRWVLRLATVAVRATGASAQKFDDFGWGRAREMLHKIAEDVKKRF